MGLLCCSLMMSFHQISSSILIANLFSAKMPVLLPANSVLPWSRQTADHASLWLDHPNAVSASRGKVRRPRAMPIGDWDELVG